MIMYNNLLYKESWNNYEKKQYYFSNYYYYYYLSCATYRESCYQCSYANMNRVGDFTLGDFWGAEGLNLSFSIDGGCSLVLVNTPKAMSLFNKLDLDKQTVPLEIAKKYNKQYDSFFGLHCRNVLTYLFEKRCFPKCRAHYKHSGNKNYVFVAKATKRCRQVKNTREE